MALDLLTRLSPRRRVECPFCFERFRANAMHFRCDNHYCKTDFSRTIEDPILTRAINGPRWTASAGKGSMLRSPWWTDPRSDRSRGGSRFLDRVILPKELICPNCSKPTDHRLCPKCHGHLPDEVVRLDFGRIAVFGPQSVGKTTYLTVLIHELDHRVGPEHGFVLDPLTDEVRDRYEREFHEMTYGGSRFGLGEASVDDDFRTSHSATPSIDTNRRILQPLVFKLTRRGKRNGRAGSSIVSLFDTAGEDWEMNIDLLRGEGEYLRRTKGLLFLVDPLRLRDVARDERIRLTEKESRVPAADYLGDARKLVSFFRKSPVNVPLAIVLNKLDRWGGLAEDGTLLRELARSVPTSPPDDRSDQIIHDEVVTSLRRWGAAGFLEYVALNFPIHRFFACSSLGDAAQESEDSPQPLPTPLLVERPVLWLMNRQGLI